MISKLHNKLNRQYVQYLYKYRCYCYLLLETGPLFGSRVLIVTLHFAHFAVSLSAMYWNSKDLWVKVITN
jgi:hypothetical protein